MSLKPRSSAWYLNRRNANMRQARRWQAHYRNSHDAGSLDQMRIRVLWARQHNHHALRARREGR